MAVPVSLRSHTHTLLCSLLFFYMITLLYYFPLHANADALSFNLTNFNETLQNVNITVTGDAYVSNKGIQITPANGTWKAGRATYKDPLHLWDKASGNLTDFNTHFLFVIDSQGNSSFGDGLAFFLLPSNSTSINAAGAAMGLPITSIQTPQSSPSGALEIKSTPFVAVEFDTYQNQYWDPNHTTPGTHVGIDINTIISNTTEVWYNNITQGKDIEAWISYDSNSQNLSVVFTGYANNSRIESGLSWLVDLRDYLPEWVNIGFSAGTGNFLEKHTIKSWSFNSSLSIDVNPSPSPSPNGVSSGTSSGIDCRIICFGWWVGFAWLVL